MGARDGRANVEWAPISGPVLTLGEAQGSSELIFARIRAVRWLSDGGLVVADGATQEIRVFDRVGRLEERFGGNGNGPAEFLYLQSAAVMPGDTIAAYDSRAHRISVFTRAGTLVRDTRLPGSGAIGDELVGRLGGEAYLIAKSALPGEGPEGIQRGHVQYVRHDLRDGTSDTLATVPGREIEFVRNASGFWTTYEIPFARSAFHATGRSSWYAGSNDRFEITERDADGVPVRSITLSEAEEPLTGEEIERVEAATIQQLNPTGLRLQSIQRLFREVAAPDLRPSFAEILVDDSERLWVAEWSSTFARPGPGTRRLRVFDESGAVLGFVAVPTTFKVHDIRLGRIAGVDVDLLGVERVVVFELSR